MEVGIIFVGFFVRSISDFSLEAILRVYWCFAIVTGVVGEIGGE